MTAGTTAETAAVAAPSGPIMAPVPAAAPAFLASLHAVATAQLSRARVARIPLFFAATLQSVGIALLLRGVVDTSSDVTKQSVVAGCTVLVVAFVALNLLAQRFGTLRAAGSLDYYGALPVRPAAVVLGIAAAWAAFTLPGGVLTAVVGCLLYGLPMGALWMVLPVLVVGGAALAGLGALIGLLLPRPELATVVGQLGMAVVMFLGIIPADRFPGALRGVRAAVPSTYAVDALAGALRPRPDWVALSIDLVICVAVAVVALAVASWAYRRAVSRG